MPGQTGTAPALRTNAASSLRMSTYEVRSIPCLCLWCFCAGTPSSLLVNILDSALRPSEHCNLWGAERAPDISLNWASGSCRMASPRTCPKATISSQLPSTPCAESSPRARMSTRVRSRPWDSPRPRPSRSGTRYEIVSRGCLDYGWRWAAPRDFVSFLPALGEPFPFPCPQPSYSFAWAPVRAVAG